MKLKFSFKTEIMGGHEGDMKKLKVLNRQLSWSRGAILWEAGRSWWSSSACRARSP